MGQETMTSTEFGNMVSLALYAMERGYDVEMIAAGVLLLRPREENKQC